MIMNISILLLTRFNCFLFSSATYSYSLKAATTFHSSSACCAVSSLAACLP